MSPLRRTDRSKWPALSKWFPAPDTRFRGPPKLIYAVAAPPPISRTATAAIRGLGSNRRDDGARDNRTTRERRQAALRLVHYRSSVRRLSRSGMGSARARRPAALRNAVSRGCAGWLELAHRAPQARDLSSG